MISPVRGVVLRALGCCLAAALAAGCEDPAPSETPDTGVPDAGGDAGLDADVDAVVPTCETPRACATLWEQHASDRFDAVLADPTARAAFLKAVPKGGDLHNHLTGAVYAETFLGWGHEDGYCINSTTLAAVFSTQCSASTLPVPTEGALYERIIDAWSMRNFVPGVQTGHDHFFATFGKFGAIAGAHRNDEIADIALRAFDENQLYIETMFNLGTNLGSLAASTWSGTLAAGDLATLHTRLLADPQFASRLNSDVAAVTGAASGYRTALGCDRLSPPLPCDVTVRFVAQISRTGANDQIFGQLVSAFEMARVSPQIVGANLSSPEDDSASVNNYDLHMAMLAFLHDHYTATGLSPLKITLHAGELGATSPGSGDDHIRKAVEIAHAARIGHGVDVLMETDPEGLMTAMRDRNVLAEICLSSNDQILEVSGAAHPLAQYLAHGVPIALATDDQGVSRSSMAGEYERAALDQGLDYRQLKTVARQSLEHAFLPGASLWQSVADGEPAAACAWTDTMGLGGTPNATCQPLLDGSERARMQWELERRFTSFERVQPAP